MILASHGKNAAMKVMIDIGLCVSKQVIKKKNLNFPFLKKTSVAIRG